MIRVEALVALVTLALWIFCLVDAIGADEAAIRHLPKLWWLLIVLLFPLAGSVAWVVAGRPDSRGRAASAYERSVPEFGEYDRPGRAAATSPERDDAFLRDVRARAEEQRARYRAEQRRREGEADA